MLTQLEKSVEEKHAKQTKMMLVPLPFRLLSIFRDTLGFLDDHKIGALTFEWV